MAITIKEQSESSRICVITAPLLEIQGGHVLVENLLQILEPLAEKLSLVTGNYPQSAVFSPKIRLRNVKYDHKKQSMLIRIPKAMLLQLKMSYHLITLAREFEVLVFFVGATDLLLPMLTAKLLRKKTIVIATGSGAQSAEQQYKDRFFGKGGFIFSRIIAILESLNRRLSDRIVVYSPSMVSHLGLGKYEGKILADGGRFVDINHFRPRKRLCERENSAGYIGRLDQEKGIMNFSKAIPLILKQQDDVDFLIAGDGSLFYEIEEVLKKFEFKEKVELTGWIPHEKLPIYLNQMKLVISPSYTEGLPNIVLEAMACGTPVLVAPVGGIPDIIKDGETGFIMKDNSPECIAKNAIRALNHPDLEEITQNARALIERKFTYEKAVERYREILSELLSKR